MEYEFALGEFRKHKFLNQVSKSIFDEYLKIMNINKNQKHEQVYYLDDKIILKINNDYYLKQKNKIGKTDFEKWGIRFTIAEENIEKIKLNKTEINNLKLFRDKYRYSFCPYKQNKWRFDITCVIQNGETLYQIELEWVNPKIVPSKEDINEGIIIMKPQIQILLNIYTNFDKNFISSEVIALDFEKMDLLKTQNWAVTDKADGERKFLFYTPIGLYTGGKSGLLNKLNNTNYKNINMFDTEYLKELDKYLIFDIIIYNGKNITNMKFKERYNILKMDVELEKNTQIKEFINLDKNLSNTKKIIDKKYNYKLDGLIFTNNDAQYIESSLKWKPPDELTIDFLIYKDMLCSLYPKKLLNKEINTPLYKEFINVFSLKTSSMLIYPFMYNKPEIYKIKMNYNLNSKNMKIYECIWNNDGKCFKIIKFREDKQELFEQAIKEGRYAGPNKFSTALSVFNLAIKPITKEMITGEVQAYYTSKTNTNLTQQSRKFHNEVKRYLYKEYIKSGDKVLELAGGKGGDLPKLKNIGVKNITLVNIAQNGLNEAAKRAAHFKLNIKTIMSNLTNTNNKIFKNLRNNKYNIVSIMFAIHYMWGDKKTASNLIKFISDVLTGGGFLLLTLFDGDKINKLLDGIPYNDSVVLKNKDTRIFEIWRKYKEYESFGSLINVYGESIGTHMEFLVPPSVLIELCKEFDLKLIKQDNFKKLREKSGTKIDNPDELKWSYLNTFYVFQKL